MEYTDKELFKKALSIYTSNADEIFEDVYENNNWDEVIIWEPFENYDTNVLEDLVVDLQTQFIDVRDKK